MKKLFFLLLLCFSSSGIMAQSLSISNQTIFESLSTLSPTLYNYIKTTATKLYDVLNHSNYSITLLLPNEAALNASIGSGKLNFSQPTNINYNILSFLMLNGTYTQQSFQSARKFYTTLQPSSAPVPVISIGPLLSTTYQSTKNISLFSGISKANMLTEIQCRNGMIQIIDEFLQPAESPLTTISILPETEYLEGLLKSLNISETISGPNKTILAPVNEAWLGSTIPFGTLVHNLNYLVINNVYTSEQLIHGASLTSDYKKLSIHVGLNGSSLVVNQDKANIVMTDILTTHGVIHLIDKVINADAELVASSKNGARGGSGGGGGGLVPADSSSVSSFANYAVSHNQNNRKSSCSSCFFATPFHIYYISVLLLTLFFLF